MSLEQAAKQRLVYAGSYTNQSSTGIYIYQFNEETGILSRIGQQEGIRQPTFLASHPTKNVLYAVCELMEQDSKKVGAAAVFEVNPSTGELAAIQTEATTSTGACYITLDRSSRCLLLAHYGGGGVSVFKLDERGSIISSADFYAHSHASRIFENRQETPHPHSVYTDPSNQFVLVPDLGADRIVIYQLDAEKAKLTLHKEIDVEPGTGPRHLAFHPSLPFVYVANELGSSVSVFSFDSAAGNLHFLQTITSLPEDFVGSNSCAEIHVSPAGSHVYISNRGHDSLAVYAINQTNGKLTLVEYVSTGGGHPRNFVLSPDGRYLLAANRDSNNIVTFRVDRDSGKLQVIAVNNETSEPVCIHFWKNRQLY